MKTRERKRWRTLGDHSKPTLHLSVHSEYIFEPKYAIGRNHTANSLQPDAAPTSFWPWLYSLPCCGAVNSWLNGMWLTQEGNVGRNMWHCSHSHTLSDSGWILSGQNSKKEDFWTFLVPDKSFDYSYADCKMMHLGSNLTLSLIDWVKVNLACILFVSPW